MAKLDRLSCSVAFIATLMDSKGFDLAMADMPGANRLTLVVSRSFRTFDLGLAAPGTGSSGDGTSHLLILQQLDVQITFAYSPPPPVQVGFGWTNGVLRELASFRAYRDLAPKSV